MLLELTDALRADIQGMPLEELRRSILVEMRSKPVCSPEVCEFLLQTYTNKLAELYW